MIKPLFIYIHGFNSSPQSVKAREFADYLRLHNIEAEYKTPALSHWPEQAIQELQKIIEQAPAAQPICLIGSSLGGYYSTFLAEKYTKLKAILINPAIEPYILMQPLLGQQQNLYTQERYLLTEQHIQQLIDLKVDNLRDPSQYFLLVQTADEVLDYQQAVEKFAQSKQIVEQGGNHSFMNFQQHIPAILEFSKGVKG